MSWWWNKLALVTITVCSFLVTAMAVRALLPLPEAGALRAKVAAFQSEGDSFDAIFIGSSYIFHGLDPSVIDPVVSRRSDRPFASFNLGVRAANGHEVDQLIRETLDDPPERLRFVVIEALDFNTPMITSVQVLNARAVWWHTPRTLRRVLSKLAWEDRPLRPRREDALAHLRHFARYVTNAGRGREFVWPLDQESPSHESFDPAEMLRTRGYSALLATGKHDRAASRIDFMKNPRKFERERDNYAAPRMKPRPDPISDAAIAEQIAFLRQRNLVPIYVVPPIFTTAARHEDRHQRGITPRLLSYASPTAHPDLFAVEMRWDKQHLVADGARLWSVKFARDLAEIVAAERTSR